MRYLLLIFFLLGTLSLFAQDSLSVKPFPKNTIFIEIGGNATLSLNYDRIFYQKNKWKFSYRTGLGIIPYDRLEFTTVVTKTSTSISVEMKETTTSYWLPLNIAVPVEINVLYGKKRHFAEFGVSYTAGWLMRGVYIPTQIPPVGFERKYAGGFSFRLNYRRQAAKGLFWKVGGMIFNDTDFDNRRNPYYREELNLPTQIGGKDSRWFWAAGIGVGKSF